MKLDDLNLGRDALDALLGLSLKVELLSHRRFKATKSLDEMVGLLKVSQVADIDDIRVAFDKFMGILTPDQHLLFRTLGIDTPTRSVSSKSYRGKQPLEQAAPPAPSVSAQSYRGQKIAPQPSTPQVAPVPTAEVNAEGKRKVIYRGRVTWV